MSGLGVLVEILKKPNEFKTCTPNPDRITAGQRGCKVQRLFGFQKHQTRSLEDEIKGVLSGD